jgi:UDP-glucuronate decarboxylase
LIHIDLRVSERTLLSVRVKKEAACKLSFFKLVLRCSAGKTKNRKKNLASMINMSSILVTGCAGFIGSNLCRRLLAQGEQIIGVDDLSSGNLAKIQDVLSNTNFSFIQHNIIEPLKVTKPLKRIYNLACPASPPRYQANPIHTLKTSVIGSMNLLELAREHNATILQASTSEIYGDPLEHPQKETYWGNVNSIGLRSCYDEGKRCAETMFFEYWRAYGVKIKVVRIFNTYGPYMDPDDGRVVSNFIVGALQGKPLLMYGNGTHTRSFCYIDDLVDGLLAMMQSPAEITGPINLGNPGEFTIAQLADKVLQMTGSLSVIEHRGLPSDDPTRRKPDITKAETLLAWQPKIALDEGLRRTISYFEAHS